MKRIVFYTMISAFVCGNAGAAMAGFGGGDDHPRIGRMIEKMDANKDGAISKEEYMSHTEERFSKMDVNGDGKIDAADQGEMKKKLMEKRKSMQEESGADKKDTEAKSAE